MISFSRNIVALISGMVIATPAVSQAPSAFTPVIIQTFAGDFDEAGWVFASAIRGNFSASLPCQFTEIVSEPASDGSGNTPIFFLGCKNGELATFSITRMLPNGDGGLQSNFDGFAQKIATESKWQSSFKLIKLNGLNAWLGSLNGYDKCAFIQAVNTGSDIVIMNIESKADICSKIDDETKAKFFQSLKIGGAAK